MKKGAAERGRTGGVRAGLKRSSPADQKNIRGKELKGDSSAE